jgi:hypothetical protein
MGTMEGMGNMGNSDALESLQSSKDSSVTQFLSKRNYLKKI